MAIQLPRQQRSTGVGSRDVGVAPSRRPVRCADERFDRLRRECPSCGELGARIVYGYPTRVLQIAARQGKVILGGCTHRGATHECPTGHRWEDISSVR